MEKKYQLTDETIEVGFRKLHRIIAVRDFGDVKKGALGGFIESESNLSHDGNAWVYCSARVYGKAWVYGEAEVYGEAWVSGNAEVYGNARVSGNAEVSDNADYIVFKNFWSTGRYFTWTRNNDMWAVGCFYGTGEELIAKAYKDSEESGRNYERVVRYVETLKNEEFNK